MNFLISKNSIIILSLLLIIGLIVVFFGSNSTKPGSLTQTIPITSSQPKVIQSPTPNSILYSPAEGVKYYALSPENQALMKKNAIIGKLIDKMPYSGLHFKLDYNFSNGKFIESYSSPDQDKANNEFIEYLKTNNLQRSDIQDILIIDSH